VKVFPPPSPSADAGTDKNKRPEYQVDHRRSYIAPKAPQ
jgi:hypothetical protein